MRHNHQDLTLTDDPRVFPALRIHANLVADGLHRSSETPTHWLMACATVAANAGPTLRSRGAFVRCQCADVIALKRGYNVDDNLPPRMALAGNVAHHIR
jgi:hypothetical protein